MHEQGYWLQRTVLIFYDILFSLFVFFVLLPYFLIGLVFGKNSKEEILERLGFPPIDLQEGPYLCLHAVSVGEVASIEPLLRRLEQRAPMQRVLLTVGNQAGMVRGLQLKHRYENVAECVFLPWDYSLGLKSWFRRVPIGVMGVVETEIWPGLFHRCRSLEIPLMIINGRLYERDFGHYRKLRWFFAPLLQDVCRAGVQSAEEARRFQVLGVPGAKIEVIANLKYDELAVEESGEEVEAGMAKGVRELWVLAGSTHPGEDEIIENAFRRVSSRLSDYRLRLVLAPRDVTRASSLHRRLRREGRDSQLFSRIQSKNWEVLILDEIGKLKAFYRACDAAVLGGSFVNHGGHNPLEAIWAGCPVMMGPYFGNFESIVKELIAEEGLILVKNEEALSSALELLLSDREHAKKLSSRARRLVRQHRGSAEVYVEKLLSALTEEAESR